MPHRRRKEWDACVSRCNVRQAFAQSVRRCHARYPPVRGIDCTPGAIMEVESTAASETCRHGGLP
jgi:hypothetical protein